MSIIEKALEKSVAERSAHADTIVGRNDLADFENDAVSLDTTTTRNDHEANDFDLDIEFEMLEERGMLLPDVTNQISEEYRVIKRPLIMNAFGEGDSRVKNANIILVTSSLPGEGKTFTAINLALSIATERDKTVLLVDGDVAKPSISKILNIESKLGLIDLLSDPNLSFSDTLLKTNIPNLSILPAGQRHRHSTELLASESMKRLTTEMSQRYPDRIIIFDSPPLMVATQGGVMVNHVGQVVMVIESEVSPQDIVTEAVQKLEPCEIVGCILNKTKKGFGLNYYAYYGYYGR